MKIRVLIEAGRSEATIPDVCREHRTIEQTPHFWKDGFGMPEVTGQAAEKKWKHDNERLKRVLANERMVKELSRPLCVQAFFASRSMFFC